VISIYASGLYIGSGIGIFIGGLIVDNWNNAYPIISEAPFGLKGWQVAFMAVGIPGMLLALLTWQIKEPPRGLSEGLMSSESKNPLKETFKELVGLTPFGLLGSDNFKKELFVNIIFTVSILLASYYLYVLTGDFLQWTAFGIGVYVICNWIHGLKKQGSGCIFVDIQKQGSLTGSSLFSFHNLCNLCIGCFWTIFLHKKFFNDCY
jgi:MFS family permease